MNDRPRFLAAIVLTVLLGRPARTDSLLWEDFASDPIVAGRAAVTAGDASRFEYADHNLLGSYDAALPTAKLAWPLARALDASLSFHMEVVGTIDNDGFFADPNHFAQVAFGLVNSQETGNDRAGGRQGDAFAQATIDYFPNVSPIFGGPSLAPTVIGADLGVGYFQSIQFPFGLESGLDDEGPLPFDMPLTFVLDYMSDLRLLTLRVDVDNRPLPLNANRPELEPGGFDGDDATIQLQLELGTSFSFDQFAILLWEDTFLSPGDPASVQAQVCFEHIRITTGDVNGDTNGDGMVNLEDLNNVRNHFGEVGDGILGDAFPPDGRVDLGDLNLVRNHFGAAATSYVPEPSASGLAAAALLAVLTYHVSRASRNRRFMKTPSARCEPPHSSAAILHVS